MVLVGGVHLEGQQAGDLLSMAGKDTEEVEGEGI